MLVYEHENQLGVIYPGEDIKPPEGSKIIAVYTIKEKTLWNLDKILCQYM